MIRIGILFAALAFIGCGGGGGTGPGTDGGPTGCTPNTASCAAGENCSIPNDCQVGLTCSTTTHKCESVFVCTNDTQCTADHCSAGAGNCVCIQGNCVQRACAGDATCPGGKICTNGSCATPQAATGLTCNILTPSAVIHQGQTIAFSAVAKNANGAIIPGQTFTWSTSTTAVAAIDGSGVATGGAQTGTTNITCIVTGGSATPSAPVVLTNYGAVTAGHIRAVVTDVRSGAPLANATVVFEGSGGVIGGPVTTDAQGIADVSGTPPVNVHVFKDGYTFVSVIGTTSNDVLLPLGQTPDETRSGGFQGAFDLTAICDPGTGATCDSVEFGIAGASLPGSFIDLDFSKILGVSLQTEINFGDAFHQVVNLPSGLYLNLLGQTSGLKNHYDVVSEPGLRHAWGIGGRAPFAQVLQVLGPVLSGGGTGTDLPIGQILAGILPFLQNFRHFVKVDQNIVLGDNVEDANDINGNCAEGDTNPDSPCRTELVPDFANTTAFPTVNAKVTQQLSLPTSVTLPDLPRYNNNFLEGAIILSGANVTGRGLVPLGLSAALDKASDTDTPDGRVTNPVSFRMAPLHDGLEGSRFFVAALALSLNFVGGSPSAISGLVTQTSSVAATTPFSVSAFLGFPTAATMDLGTRKFNFNGSPVTGATFYRADFGAPEGDWVVYFKPPASGDAFTLPSPPVVDGITDRAVRDCGGTPCTTLRVYTLSTGANGSETAPTLDDLVTFGTKNLTRMNDFVNAFSNTSCQSSGTCAPAP